MTGGEGQQPGAKESGSSEVSTTRSKDGGAHNDNEHRTSGHQNVNREKNVAVERQKGSVVQDKKDPKRRR